VTQGRKLVLLPVEQRDARSFDRIGAKPISDQVPA
jgi:hypothetical protein